MEPSDTTGISRSSFFLVQLPCYKAPVSHPKGNPMGDVTACGELFGHIPTRQGAAWKESFAYAPQASSDISCPPRVGSGLFPLAGSTGTGTESGAGPHGRIATPAPGAMAPDNEERVQPRRRHSQPFGEAHVRPGTREKGPSRLETRPAKIPKALAEAGRVSRIGLLIAPAGRPLRALVFPGRPGDSLVPLPFPNPDRLPERTVRLASGNPTERKSGESDFRLRVLGKRSNASLPPQGRDRLGRRTESRERSFGRRRLPTDS